MGAGGLGCSVGTTIGVSVSCSVGGDDFCCYGAVFVLKISANFSTAVVALGPHSKKNGGARIAKSSDEIMDIISGLIL